MVRIGIIGLGFMGMTHYRAARRVRGGRVTAICTRDPNKRAGDWRRVRGNFGSPGGIEDLSSVTTYEAVDDLLADPDIDLVDVCLPSRMHADVALAALGAGKHVLVEKPIATTVRDADRMQRGATRAGRRLMVAQILCFMPEYRFAREAVRTGRYGRLLGGHFKRMTSNPNWGADPSTSDGPALGLHIHDLHFILATCGRPTRIHARGVALPNTVPFLTSLLEFPDRDLTISATTGWFSQPARPFTQAFEIYLERASLSYEFSTLRGRPVLTTPLTLMTADGRVRRPKLKSTDPLDAFVAEVQHAVDVVRGKAEPGALGAGLARDALALCMLENESVRRGRPVAVR